MSESTNFESTDAGDYSLDQVIKEGILADGESALVIVDENLPVFNLTNGIDWAWFGREAAGGVIGSVAGGIVVLAIKRELGLNINYAELFDGAINEIVERVGHTIEMAFFNEYMSDCESIRSELITYSETKNVEILMSIRPRISQLTSRLRTLGENNHGKTAGSFIMAATLHLFTIRALAAHDDSYKATLKRLCSDYADTGIHLAKLFFNRVKNENVSKCEGECRWVRTGSFSDPDLTWECSKSFTYDYGVETRRFNGNGCGEGDEGCLSRVCERVRKQYYDTRVNPARDRYNAIVSTCNRWREVNIDNIRLD